MYSQNLSCASSLSSKLEQLKAVGMSLEELQCAQEILACSEYFVYLQNLQTCLISNDQRFYTSATENITTSNSGNESDLQTAHLYASYLNYLISAGDNNRSENFGLIDDQTLGYGGVYNHSSSGNYNQSNIDFKTKDSELHDSSEKFAKKYQKDLSIFEKIMKLKTILEDVTEDSKIMITGKPK